MKNTDLSESIPYLFALARFVYRMQQQECEHLIDKEKMVSRVPSEAGKEYARALLGEPTSTEVAEKAAAIRRVATGLRESSPRRSR